MALCVFNHFVIAPLYKHTQVLFSSFWTLIGALLSLSVISLQDSEQTFAKMSNSSIDAAHFEGNNVSAHNANTVGCICADVIVFHAAFCPPNMLFDQSILMSLLG